MKQKVSRKHTEEFKIQALKLAKELGSYSEAARQLGVGDSLLHAWKVKYGIQIDSKNQNIAQAVSEAEEIKRLRKENEDLKKVNYILKRAAAFFSQDHLK